jgi:hypothetical protein
MADDKNRNAASGEHHSKAKGAVIGAAAGGAIAGKKGAAVGASGAEKQHRKNEKEKGK